LDTKPTETLQNRKGTAKRPLVYTAYPLG